MSPDEWATIHFFKPDEFDSPDEPGSGHRMQFDTVRLLDELRRILGTPLRINSGVRTPGHNAEVAGSKDGSAHIDGWAADITCRTSRERLRLLRAAMILGFNRIGIGTTFIHLDADPSKPKDVIWLY